MASHIWLGGMRPLQEPATEWYGFKVQEFDGTGGGAAIIAKGNKIDGIEARY